MTAGRLDRRRRRTPCSARSRCIALYPVLSILFLALHRKTDLVSGFAFPTRIDLSSFEAAWTEGNFATGFKSSFIVAATVTVGLRRALDRHRLRLRDDALRRRPHRVPDHPARDHLPVRGDGDPALLRLPERPDPPLAPAQHVLGADPAADRAVGRVRHLLDARLLPLDAALADRGRADRRRDELRRPLARARCRRRCPRC